MNRQAQVANQCRAVAHLARALGEIYDQSAELIAAGHVKDLIDQIGNRSARHMEVIGDILNGMDAVDDEKDAWLQPVFAEAHRLWPQNAQEER